MGSLPRGERGIPYILSLTLVGDLEVASVILFINTNTLQFRLLSKLVIQVTDSDLDISSFDATWF